MEEFSQEKLIGLLKDHHNMDQNCLFIQVFPPDVIDQVWDRLDPFSEKFVDDPHAHMFEFYLLFLVAFGAEGSLAAEVRTGRYYKPLKCLPRTDTLYLTAEFHDVPTGVVSQLVEALSISELVIESEDALKALFEMDFTLISHRIKSVSFFDFNSQYQLTKTLYASEYISELSFVRIKGAILPDSLDQMRALKKLNFIQSEVYKMPVFSANIRGLESIKVTQSLSMGSVDVSGLPSSIVELDLSMNRLTSISGFSRLINLKRLDLSNTMIEQMDFSELPKSIEEINLRSCKLTEIAAGTESVDLPDLSILDLSINSLKQWPVVIGRLKGLRELLFSDNKIELISEDIGSLEQLERLDLRNNYIRVLPSNFNRLQRLNYLDLEDNQLSEIFEILDSSDWRGVRIRLRGNNLDKEKRKLITLTKLLIDL
jgi:Leucine-rich repeat (LRR) protein